MLDAFTILVMLLPLGSYLLVVGWMCSRKRPIVVSGARDFFALGLSCTGLFLAGPFSLFFPQSAFNIIGGWVWLVMLLLYFLIVVLITLGQRPRILVYSANSASFVQHVAEVLEQLDPETQWAGASFYCPKLRIEGTVDSRAGEAISQIVANSRSQDLVQWAVLQKRLQQYLKPVADRPRIVNIWSFLGLLLLLAAFSLLFTRTNETIAAMREALRL